MIVLSCFYDFTLRGELDCTEDFRRDLFHPQWN